MVCLCLSFEFEFASVDDFEVFDLLVAPRTMTGAASPGQVSPGTILSLQKQKALRKKKNATHDHVPSHSQLSSSLWAVEGKGKVPRFQLILQVETLALTPT